MDDHVAAAYQWLSDFHAHGDALSPEAWVTKFYTTDCEMRFPGQPLLKGHSAIIGFFKNQFTRLESMTHIIKHVDVTLSRTYQEATILYVVKGDPEKQKVEVKGLAVFGKAIGEDKIKFFTVYLDPSPLHDRIRLVASL